MKLKKNEWYKWNKRKKKDKTKSIIWIKRKRNLTEREKKELKEKNERNKLLEKINSKDQIFKLIQEISKKEENENEYNDEDEDDFDNDKKINDMIIKDLFQLYRKKLHNVLNQLWKIFLLKKEVN